MDDATTATATTADATAATATTATATDATATAATAAVATDAAATNTTTAAAATTTATTAAASTTAASTTAAANTAGTGTTSGTTTGQNSATTTTPTPTSSSSASDSSLTDLNLGAGPIFYTAWVKYFKMKPADQDKQQTFYKNMEFYEQLKKYPKKDFSQEMEFDGLRKVNKYVKDASHFYAMTFKNNLNFISSRSKQIAKTFDLLNIDNLDKVEESSGYGEPGPDNENGIQDFGNFAEGFCFKLFSNQGQQIWVVCTDTLEEKNKFMNMLKKLKIQNQRDHGEIVTPEKERDKKQPTSGEVLYGMTMSDDGSSVSVDPTKNNITDGYWIVLQDWTQCNLKCGGGLSTLQRMCVPPKNGGAKCEGPDVYTRPCNTQLCPNSTNIDKNGDGPFQKTLKPIVKVLPFSTRPQRYSKCIIKESDLMYTQSISDMGGSSDNQGVKGSSMSPNIEQTNIQIPTRVVMNNKTITIFAGETYDSQMHVFDLELTELKESTAHKNCFFFISGARRAELCPFGFDTSDKTLNEWDNDFNLFKHQCKTSRLRFGLNMTEDAEMAKKLKDKIAQAKKDLLDERNDEIKQKAQIDDENDLQADIKTSNNVALQAISKELNLEAMIRKEEAEREKMEVIQIQQKIDEEKKKSDCMIKNIKMKEMENQKNLQDRQVAATIASNKALAQQQISIRRNNLKQQIEKMRKETDEKKRKMLAQLQQVRMQMAGQMNKAYKEGKDDSCKAAVASDQDRYNYCTANYPDNTEKLGNCKDTDDFCIFCCDNEYGEMFDQKRASCYTNVCPPKTLPASTTDTAANADKENQNGRWMWQASVS